MLHTTETTLPTQSPATQDAYARRYNQLVRAARHKLAAESGQAEASVRVTPAVLADFLIGKKRSYAAASWRLVRRSVTWSLEEMASRVDASQAREIEAAIARLRAEEPDPDETRGVATSSTKAKGLSVGDAMKIQHAALASRAKCAPDLVRYLKVGVITGLRPGEWANAELRRSSREGFQWMLVVANAKATNGRAHGPFRTLYWVDLPTEVVEDISAWIEIAHRPDYKRRLATIGRLLWQITRKLWPRRKSWPTLYSTRHEAVARWKSHYVRDGQTDHERGMALATIGALMGHGSDDTATQHYARATAANTPSFAVPAAEPAEVARVRQVMDPKWRETLRASKQRKI